jgi:hypothetical protein
MQVVETLFPDLTPQYRARIYFGLGQNGQLKIGLTGRKDGRRGGEMHFTELCSVPGDRLTESGYHSRYADCRIGRTEWFHLTDRLLMDLLVMCVQQGRARSTEILKELILGRLSLQAAA